VHIVTGLGLCRQADSHSSNRPSAAAHQWGSTNSHSRYLSNHVPPFILQAFASFSACLLRCSWAMRMVAIATMIRRTITAAAFPSGDLIFFHIEALPFEPLWLAIRVYVGDLARRTVRTHSAEKRHRRNSGCSLKPYFSRFVGSGLFTGIYFLSPKRGGLLADILMRQSPGVAVCEADCDLGHGTHPGNVGN
jgi:hypothetical protein